MLKIELPLMNGSPDNLRTFLLYKDLKTEQINGFTLRRIEQLRDTIIKTLNGRKRKRARVRHWRLSPAMTGYGGSRFRVDMSLLVKILATLFVLPLLYLSGVRLVSQLILPTDSSSLWATPSLDACPRSEAPSFVPRILSLLDPLSSDYKTLLARTLVGQNDPMPMRRSAGQ